jgi:hypothetical protein
MLGGHGPCQPPASASGCCCHSRGKKGMARARPACGSGALVRNRNRSCWWQLAEACVEHCRSGRMQEPALLPLLLDVQRGTGARMIAWHCLGPAGRCLNATGVIGPRK